MIAEDFVGYSSAVPQVAIRSQACVGLTSGHGLILVGRRVVIAEDFVGYSNAVPQVAIRSQACVALTFRHGLIDEALAVRFTAKVKQVLESWSEDVL